MQIEYFNLSEKFALMGIEPRSSDYKANILPFTQTRPTVSEHFSLRKPYC